MNVLDLAVLGHSLASGDPRYGEVPPSAALDGPDVLCWYAGGWQQALSAAGGSTPPGIGEWAAKLSRRLIHGGKARIVRWHTATQNGASIAAFVPGQPNYDGLMTDLAASNAEPAAVVLWHGANDIGMSSATYAGHLDAIIVGLKAELPNARLLCVDCPPTINGADMTPQRVVHGYCADAGLVELVSADHWVTFAQDGVHLPWGTNVEVALTLEGAL